MVAHAPGPKAVLVVPAPGALLEFQEHGDTSPVRRQLVAAVARNPHVPAYLLERRNLPAEMPLAYGIGDAAEAVVCAKEQGNAWRQTPRAR
jgi:hypothetical protein